MGVGPAVAIPKLLDATGVSVDEVGIWEINEAFASQALYCVRKLGIDESKVNPKGGAIARGHPLGKWRTFTREDWRGRSLTSAF
jgi:acetyl-CoA acyltransferase 1